MTALKGLLELYVVAQDFSGGLATWIEGFSELHTLDIRLDSTSDPYNAGYRPSLLSPYRWFRRNESCIVHS